MLCRFFSFLIVLFGGKKLFGIMLVPHVGTGDGVFCEMKRADEPGEGSARALFLVFGMAKTAKKDVLCTRPKLQ